jgi:hypothetical protein
VWRAANGINPQDLRPTGGGGQLETLPAFWKQRLDRDIARATDQPPPGLAQLLRDLAPGLVEQLAKAAAARFLVPSKQFDGELFVVDLLAHLGSFSIKFALVKLGLR